MAVNDKGGGPKVGMPVYYNNAGTVTAAMIYAVRSNGLVDINWFGSGGATAATSVGYSNGATVTSTWGFPDYF